MRRFQNSTGIIIIVLGILILLGKAGVYQTLAGWLWPFLLLIPGLLIHYAFFSQRAPSVLLIPAAMLVTYSLMFFFCSFFGWHHMGWLWPGFIVGLSIGLYEYYLFDTMRSRGILPAALILALLAFVLFFFTILNTTAIYFIAIALIVIGVALVIRPRFR